MLLLHMVLSFLFGFALGQTSCGTVPAAETFKPVIMRYTPFMTAQVGPTSIIWDQIVTTWFNAVDCRYVTPLRVDENPAPEGPFTTFVRSPVLTITRVGCMPETTLVTRRDVRDASQMELRSVGALQEHKMQKRRTAQEAIDQVIEDMPVTFPSDTSSLTLQAYRYMVSVTTAIFAINLVQAGIDLNQSCAQLRDPISQARLFRTTIDPVQAGDIVCFAANSGLYFSVSISEVVTYLEDLIYAIQVRSSYPEDSDDFCWPLITEDSPFLGVDTQGIAQYLCPSGNIPSLPTTATTTGTTEPTESSSTHFDGSGSSTIAGPPTGGPFANSTGIGPSVTANPGYNTNTNTNSSIASATLTPAPYGNSTANASVTTFATNSVGTISSYGTSIIFPNVTYSNSGTDSGLDTTTDVSTTTEGGTITDIGTIADTDTATDFDTATDTATDVGTVTVLSTGGLPAFPTSVSPEIESVTSNPTRRFRRW